MAGLQPFEGCVLWGLLLFLIWTVIKLAEGFVIVVESSGLKKSPLALKENRFDQESGNRGSRELCWCVVLSLLSREKPVTKHPQIATAAVES